MQAIKEVLTLRPARVLKVRETLIDHVVEAIVEFLARLRVLLELLQICVVRRRWGLCELERRLVGRLE